MNPTGKPDGPTLNDQLLRKADALIRRNRPDGVGTDAEELPLLTDAVDDLPELTDAIAFPVRATERDGLVEFTLDLEDLDDAHGEEPTPLFLTQTVRDTEERVRAQLNAAHEKAIEAVKEQLQAEAAAEQAKAVESALAASRSEAETTQRTLVEQARRDARQAAALAMSEHLVELDAYLAQAIDQWMIAELPQIITTEMAGMVERIRSRAGAHLRATLLPELSEKLSSVLDGTQADSRQP